LLVIEAQKVGLSWLLGQIENDVQVLLDCGPFRFLVIHCQYQPRARIALTDCVSHSPPSAALHNGAAEALPSHVVTVAVTSPAAKAELNASS
jgi:hypothetical protein